MPLGRFVLREAARRAAEWDAITLGAFIALGVLFYLNLILYGSVVEARGSLTQTMISDFAKENQTDAAFSIYYFVGCISGPIWTLIVGYVMQNYGFTPAFLLAASTYLAGMLLLSFVREEPKRPQVA